MADIELDQEEARNYLRKYIFKTALPCSEGVFNL